MSVAPPAVANASKANASKANAADDDSDDPDTIPLQFHHGQGQLEAPSGS
jgi:hypothetical protein